MPKGKAGKSAVGSCPATVARLKEQGFRTLDWTHLMISPEGTIAVVNLDGSYETLSHIADARRAAGLGNASAVAYHPDGNLKG